MMQTLPVAQEAAHELCQDLCEFLSRRYPQVYTVERSSKNTFGWYGDGNITKIEMPALNASYDLVNEDPIKVRPKHKLTLCWPNEIRSPVLSSQRI